MTMSVARGRDDIAAAAPRAVVGVGGTLDGTAQLAVVFRGLILPVPAATGLSCYLEETCFALAAAVCDVAAGHRGVLPVRSVIAGRHVFLERLWLQQAGKCFKVVCVLVDLRIGRISSQYSILSCKMAVEKVKLTAQTSIPPSPTSFAHEIFAWNVSSSSKDTH